MFAMVHVRNGVELGRCRVAHDELGYPLLVAAMREPEMLELVEGMEAGDELRFEEGDRAVPNDPPCAYCGEPTVQGDCGDPQCEANNA